jgi:hypothetical protein
LIGCSETGRTGMATMLSRVVAIGVGIVVACWKAGKATRVDTGTTIGAGVVETIGWVGMVVNVCTVNCGVTVVGTGAAAT